MEVTLCNQFTEQLKDFVTATQTRKVRGADGHQAMLVQQIIDAIYESSATGQSIDVST